MCYAKGDDTCYMCNRPVCQNHSLQVDVHHICRRCSPQIQTLSPQAAITQSATSSDSWTEVETNNHFSSSEERPQATEDSPDIQDAQQHFAFMLINHNAFPSNEPMKNFTVVKGNNVYGLIIDPGAARGLIGSDSLREIIVNVLKPAKQDRYIKWSKSHNSFTGISAQPQTSIGMVKFPIGLLGMSRAAFRADVIGGQASKCPGLVPLQSLQQQGCVIACGYFKNGDGLLGIRLASGHFCTQRLLLTDSGHYLMPVHYFDKKSDRRLDQLMTSDYRHLDREGRRMKDDGSRDAAIFAIGCLPDEEAQDSLFQ